MGPLCSLSLSATRGTLDLETLPSRSPDFILLEFDVSDSIFILTTFTIHWAVNGKKSVSAISALDRFEFEDPSELTHLFNIPPRCGQL